MIFVLKVNVGSIFNICQNAFLQQCLPKKVFIEASRYRRWQDQQAYLGGRYLLLKALDELHLPSHLLDELKYSKFGKPYLPINLNFNITHSGEFVLLAVSDSHKIGIDAEKIKKVNLTEFQNQFTDLELLNICQADNKLVEFFKYWTIKEAVMKADGRGLSIDFKQILVTTNAYLDGKLWYIKEIALTQNYIAHIATNALLSSELKIETIVIPTINRI